MEYDNKIDDKNDELQCQNNIEYQFHPMNFKKNPC